MEFSAIFFFFKFRQWKFTIFAKYNTIFRSLTSQGIDYESFASLRDDQIKEAIPDVIPRIMFENKFKKFQENVAKTGVVGDDSICVIINANQSTEASSYGAIDEPIFDKDFDSFNSVTGPVMVSKTIISSQKPPQKFAINSVQVKFFSILKAIITTIYYV